jgi:hypothetical protein
MPAQDEAIVAQLAQNATNAAAGHARLGNRARALRTYQRCVERLREELDVPPSAATVGLFEELRVG